MTGKKLLRWTGRFILLLLLFYVLFIIGTIPLSGLLPDAASEPGLLSGELGFLILGVANTLLIIGLILSSQWRAWKLALSLGLAYYGAVTFLPQVETWYFLSDVTVNESVLQALFIMGLPIAFVHIPLAVWILGKWRKGEKKVETSLPLMPVSQWAWKLFLIAVIYLILYWSAGYFIAWQNPELREFYGSPGAILPFWEHTMNTLREEPGLLAFQLIRGVLWTLCALPLILGSKINAWGTAILVGFLFTIPQNLGLLLENPLMPLASVRLSHMIETVSSNFIFGMIVVWLFHRKHNSVIDLFRTTS